MTAVKACARARRATCAAVLLFLGCDGVDRSTLTPIGAGWYFHLQSHLPEAGWVPTDLYRDWKGKPVLVAKNIEQHQFYEPDCIVFVTGHADPPYVTYAACGDRLPVAIDVRDYRHWTLGPDGPRYENPARVVDGVPTKWTETIALDRLKEVAVRQPPFDPGWQPSHRGAKGVLQAVEADVPVGGPPEPAAAGVATTGGRPPLVDAAATDVGTEQHRLDRLALVDALIKRGEAVDATDQYGYTALMMAASKGDPEMVQRLIDAGASVNARSGDGRTALMIGAETLGDRIETVRALVNAGADRAIRDGDGQTAADRMRSTQDAELLSLLE